MSGVLLGIIAVLVVLAHPTAAVLAELITGIELRWIAGDLPWTP